ncbi:MAG TPA: DUF4738 domain-containing protein [Cytophagaceae bacterium]|jgi:hypothetical protein
MRIVILTQWKDMTKEKNRMSLVRNFISVSLAVVIASTLVCCRNETSKVKELDVISEKSENKLSNDIRFEPENTSVSRFDSLFKTANGALQIAWTVQFSKNDYLEYQYGNESSDLIYYRNRETIIKVLNDGTVVLQDSITKSDFKKFFDSDQYSSVYLSEVIVNSESEGSKILTFLCYLNVPETDVRWVFEYSFNEDLKPEIKSIE